MHLDSGRRIIIIFTAVLLIGFCVAEATAQTRRTKKSRRVTNPVTTTTPAATPTPSTTSSDPRIISTADETSDSTSTTGRRTRSRRNASSEPDEEPTRDKVDRLSAQFNSMNEKLSMMEQQQRTLVDLERLSRAESRAEGLRAQLRDVQSKEAELQARALQLEYEVQPSVIERSLAAYGSTRPEELREQRRRMLEAEKTSVQTQLNQLAVSRTRLETAIANAEAEADRLRTRVDAAMTPAATDPASTDIGTAPETTTQSPDMGEGEPEQ